MRVYKEGNYSVLIEYIEEGEVVRCSMPTKVYNKIVKEGEQICEYGMCKQEATEQAIHSVYCREHYQKKITEGQDTIGIYE